MIKNLIRKWPNPKFYNAKAVRPEGLISVDYSVYDHIYDVIVIGGGGAGLRAGVSLSEKGYHTACISKLFPTRSHTVAAQGGINAALGNMNKDDWRYHYYDTAKSSQGLGDLDAISYMCKEAPSTVYELENYGMPFSRTKDGKIIQKAFGGQTTHYGKLPAMRSAYAGNKTGHNILYTLTGKAMENECRLLVDYAVIELIILQGVCRGVVALELREGSIHRIQANSTIIATGGCGRIFSYTSQAFTCTGDGQALVSKAGLPNQDLEFVQFHPTGLYGSGLLITEMALEEGGRLINGLGKTFMQNYSDLQEKASRDVVCKAIHSEISEGRGAGEKKDHVWLDLTGLTSYTIKTKLPGLSETLRIFGKLDVFTQKIPVIPTAHYNMGGIPTDYKTRVIINSKGDICPNLYAAGEAACASVHGANRLAANSLIETLVFGRAAAQTISETIKPGQEQQELPNYVGEETIEKIEKIRVAKGNVKVCDIRAKMQEIMQSHAGIVRDGESLNDGIRKLDEVSLMLKNIKTIDRGLYYNLEILDTLELENMIITAKQTLASAKYREESRGAHIRKDFPDRNDKE